MKEIILIEDDHKKAEDIVNYLKESFDDFIIERKESYKSGLSVLLQSRKDILLLDMSIPTWDKTADGGGEFHKFGGYIILKELRRKNKLLPFILITMFDEFGESDRNVSLHQISDILKEEYPEYFNGSVFYSSSQNDWKNELNTRLAAIL